MDKRLLLIIFILVIAIVLFLVMNKSNQSADSKDVLHKIALGCMQRLRGVMRENMVTPDQLGAFLASGDKKLIVFTNLDPDTFVSSVKSSFDIKTIRGVAISSSLVNNKKKYVTVTIHDGEVSAAEFNDDLWNTIRKASESARLLLSPDENNSLVFYIDEDIPCNGTSVEKCCGKRY